jgi:ankyrin repeat protein
MRRGNGYYGNALQAAARRDNLPVIELLVKLGADINAQGGDCDNALPSCHGTADTVRLLLEHDADVNARGGKYLTALIAASRRCRVENVRTPLEHGADVHVKDKFWGSTLEAALNRPNATSPNKAATADLLRKHGATETERRGR